MGAFVRSLATMRDVGLEFYVSLEPAVGIVVKILLDSYGLNSRRLKGRQRGHLFFLRAG